MKLTFDLFFLEIKRTIKFLPRLFFGVFLVFAFLFAVLYIGEKNGTPADTRVKVGYYTPDKDDAYIPMLVNMVNEMESVKTVCILEEYDSPELIYAGIEKGDLYGGVLFPENYVQSVMHGIDDPAEVIVPGGYNNDIFKRLVSVGSDMLVSVQAGIYSTADGKKMSNREILGINMEYINFVLGRSSLFKKESWSPYGVLSLAQYYCIMLLSLASVLIGTLLSFLFYDYGDGFKSYCKLWQYNGAVMLLLKQALVFVLVCAVIIPAVMVTDNFLPVINQNYLMVFAAIFIASEIIACFYTVFGGSAVLLLTVFGIISGFFSGCFVPLVYLSGTGLDKVSSFMPVYTISQCFSSLYTYNGENVNILPMAIAIYFITFIICAVKKGVGSL